MDEKKSSVNNSNKTDTTDLQSFFAQIEARQGERRQQMIEKINGIKSLVAANDLLEDASSEIREQIFQRIITGQISGDADDYHNASVSFSNFNQPQQAAEICKKGLERWTNDVDLNADYLTYLIDAGSIYEAHLQANQMEINCPDRNEWNWRAFRFMYSYLMDTRPDNYRDRAEKLIQDYKRVLPWDEKAYRCEADMFERKGDTENAILVLEEAIANLSAPQCALHLSDIYFERAKYDDVIRVSTLGIAYAAKPQPAIRTAYLLFLRALSRDALFLKNSQFSNDMAISIIDEYELAMKYVSPREKDVIKQRIDILQAYSGLKQSSLNSNVDIQDDLNNNRE